MREPGDLIGRTDETRLACESLGRALSGAAGATVITGEAGVGKSALAAACARELNGAMLRGRAWQGTTAPFGPVADAVREALRREPALRHTLGDLGARLPLLLPELGPLPPDDELPVALIAARVFEVIAAHGPVILLLEDLQWADPATLQMLAPLAVQLGPLPVALLLTHSTEGLGRAHPLRRARADLRRAVPVAEIPLGPLPPKDAAALLTRALGAPASAALEAEVLRLSHGLPLHVEELARALRASGQLRAEGQGPLRLDAPQMPLPEGLRDAVALRLAGLSAGALAALETAAVLGGEVSLAALQDLGAQAAEIEELLDRGLLRQTAAGHAAFQHALTREVVLADIAWSRRRGLHRRTADHLERTGAPAEAIADHLLAASDLPQARRWLVRAAERLCRIHAHHDAVRVAKRALELWPAAEEEEARLGVLERLARCAQTSGLLSDARRALAELLASRALREDAGRRGEALSALATVHELEEHFDLAAHARREAAEALEAAGAGRAAVQEWLHLAGRLLMSMHLDAAREAAVRAGALAERGGDRDLAALCLSARASIEAVAGHSGEAKTLARRALTEVLSHDLFQAAPEVYRVNAFVAEYCAEYDEAWKTFQEVREQCARQGEEETARLCLSCVAWILFRQGDWRRSVEVCDNILGDPAVPPGIVIGGHGIRALIHAERGEFRSAARHNRQAGALIAKTHCEYQRIYSPYVEARIAEGEGRLDDAERCYRELMECWRRTADWYGLVIALPAAVIFWSARGDDRALMEASDALSAITGQNGNAEAQAALALALGEITLRRGDPEAAARHFAQASARCQRLNLPLEQLRAEMRLGDARRRLGDTGKATEGLTAALAQARRLGMRVLGQQIESLCGPRAVAGPAAAPATLTPRQREILALVCEGLANKEIAARLHLSTRTVDMHLRHLFDRLNVRTRTEAVRRAAERGLA